MTKIWPIEVEIRNRGAIGVFAWLATPVNAEDEASAFRKASEICRNEGYETRGVRYSPKQAALDEIHSAKWENKRPGK